MSLQVSDGASGPAHRSRLLVLEDEAILRDALAEVLLEAGYEVRTAADGALALDRLAGWPADAILLDLMMPRMNGWAFRAEQRRRGLAPDVPLIVLSGASGLAAAATELGAAAALAKPLDFEDLPAAVEHALHGRTGPGPPVVSPPRAALWLLERLHAIPPTDLRSAAAAASQLLTEAMGADKVDCFLQDPAGLSLVP